MKSWVCELCGKPISELGAYVKMTSTRHRHLTCHDTRMLDTGYQNGRRVLLEEQADEARHARELQAAREQAAQEQEHAKALAAENAKNDAARLKALTLQEQEKIKRESQGEAAERFALVEVATPEEIAAQEAAKLQEQEKLKARQDEDAKKIPKCVRCGVPTTSTDHPGHCDTCWNVDPAKPVQQDLEQDIKEALKRGVRPLELE